MEANVALGRKKLIYIAGAAHSGSTFLDIMLGEAEGAFSMGQMGEAYNLIDESGEIKKTEISNIPVWDNVYKNMTIKERKTLYKEARSVIKEKLFFHFLFSKTRIKQYIGPFEIMLNILFSLQPHINLCIDSSKNLSRALALNDSNQFTSYVVHLVRDCRGYINSTKKRESENNKKHYIFQHISVWLLKNVCASVFLRWKYSDRYIIIKYEDLILDPETELQKISGMTGVDFDRMLKMLNRDQQFSRKQMVGGNFIRTLDHISLDKSRLLDATPKEYSNLRFWLSGGFITALWGYDFGQSYMRETGENT